MFEVSVEDIIYHPNFNRNTWYDDVGLIRLNVSLRFNGFISPACLPTENQEHQMEQARAIGWGYVNFNEIDRTEFRQITLKTNTPNEQCLLPNSGQSRSRLLHGIDDQTQLCYRLYSGYEDFCQVIIVHINQFLLTLIKFKF